MGKTEYIAFRATQIEKKVLEQLARHTRNSKSAVLRELVRKEGVACGLLSEKKDSPQMTD